MAVIDVDGTKFEVKDSDNLLDACLSHRLDLPYFCWHPSMGSVGSCRQCAVRVYADENDQRGKILMACMTPVQDGMRLSIDEKTVSQFRDKSIEVTMANHPHDCPVCEEGGECHLQDMTIMSHHTERRYRGRKKTYNNQYLGPCIGHEMNRCIACYRCVRFYNDYAGGKDLAVLASRENVYFGRHEDGCLESVFSGNLAEVCPTGVFTDKTLSRSYNRKWDLQSAPSICEGCSVGCNTAPSERYGKIKRIINRYHPDVNGYFICDRGRFGYDHNNHPDRIRNATRRNGHNGDMEAIDYADAVEAARDLILAADGNVVAVGSPRASVEENYALQHIVGAENFCPGVAVKQQQLLQSILDIYRDSRVHCPSLHEIEKCDAVLVLGEDLIHSAARMALSVRQATRNLSFELAKNSQIPLWQDAAVRTLAQDQRSPLIIASVAGTELDEIASDTFNGSPNAIAQFALAVANSIKSGNNDGSELDGDALQQAQRIADTLVSAKNPLIISGTGLNSLAVVQAAAKVASALSAKRSNGSTFVSNLCYVLPEANSMGLTLLTEQQSLSADQLFDKVLNKPGDYSLVILKNDLYQWLESSNVDKLFSAAKHCIVIDQQPNHTTRQADILLPAKTVVETEGTLINYEGRAQRFFEVYETDNPELKDNWHTLVNVARAICNAGRQPTGLDEASLLQLAEVNAFDDLIALVERRGGIFSRWSQVTPGHLFRIAGMKVPRQPHRYSGRTSINANAKVAENQRPDDPDSALTFSMEGAPINVPSGLNALIWSPGWNSNEAINKFQDEIGGALRGGPPGLLVLESGSQNNIDQVNVTIEKDEILGGQLLAVTEQRLFDSHPLMSLSGALMQRAGEQKLQLNSDTGQRLNIKAGATLNLRVNNNEIKLPVVYNDNVPDNVVIVPDSVAARTHLPAALLPAVAEIVQVN